MHEQYYRFMEQPFRLTADPKCLYKSRSHARALTQLQQAIARREGLALVTGDVGTGKTTLCRALIDQADRTTCTARLLDPFVSDDVLLDEVVRELGATPRADECGSPPSRRKLIEALHHFLESLVRRGSTAVLIVDEAQAQSVQVLRQLHILSTLAADKVPLLQIVLAGQPGLLTMLRAPELRPLDARMSIRCQLTPLADEETIAYVAHRLAVAGGASGVTFTPSALRLVHEYSGGIPRLINMICHRALVAGSGAQAKCIDADLVRAASELLELSPAQAPPAEKRRWFRRRSGTSRSH